MRGIMWIVLSVGFVLSGAAWAQRAPCSGSHGGVVRCEGESFVCADGAVSGSKKICQASDYATGVVGVVEKREAGAVDKVEAGAVDKEQKKASYSIITWVVGLFAAGVVVIVLIAQWLFRKLFRLFKAKEGGKA